MSGGPDSLGLLIAAAALSGEHRVRAATVDHRLRPGSGAEAETVARWSAELGIPHRTLRWRRDRSLTGNLQAVARAARYALLAAEARRCGAGIILTAHHRHDQAETHVLLHERGARGGALAGMRAWRDLEPGVVHLRPFLEHDPVDLAQLCEVAGWRPILDPSNQDERFARVRLRTIMTEAARRSALKAAADAECLRQAEDRDLASRLAAMAGAGSLRLDPAASIDVLGDLELLDERLLARAVTTAGGALYPPSRDSLDRLRQALKRQGRATLDGCLAEARDGGLRLSREFGRVGPPPALTGEDGIAVFDRRFMVGPLPAGALVEADGANVKRRTLPAIRRADGTLDPVELADGPLPKGPGPKAASMAGWRLWADLPGPMPQGLTARPQIAAKKPLAVGKV
ncbi:tRNA lysidine(34) synthetase TilS [Aureimonas sp. AU4]|uniref:tRNA lysidine(34) synthetase TilS n=1 Tax=Aureimonas sp. AU4 TaxID=1638163 RepID=UPI000ADD9B68|nr:tRNA lysidine(34) synthetase TilS [Aureimonas sp. AU4]